MDEYSSATTSLKPKLVAAALHDPLSNIDPPSFRSLQEPLFSVEYPYAPTSFLRYLRQEPSPIVE